MIPVCRRSPYPKGCVSYSNEPVEQYRTQFPNEVEEAIAAYQRAKARMRAEDRRFPEMRRDKLGVRRPQHCFLKRKSTQNRAGDVRSFNHSTISLTLDTYSHILPDIQQEAADKMDKIFG